MWRRGAPIPGNISASGGTPAKTCGASRRKSRAGSQSSGTRIVRHTKMLQGKQLYYLIVRRRPRRRAQIARTRHDAGRWTAGLTFSSMGRCRDWLARSAMPAAIFTTSHGHSGSSTGFCRISDPCRLRGTGVFCAGGSGTGRSTASKCRRTSDGPLSFVKGEGVAECPRLME
jgi:hypothetical protein